MVLLIYTKMTVGNVAMFIEVLSRAMYLIHFRTKV